MVERESGPGARAQMQVEVLWRPGCPYCARLQRGLERAGVTTVERNIWSDPDAAALIREATGGSETVPTVVIGSRVLVNPSAARVLEVMRVEFGEDAESLISAVSSPGSGLSWTTAAAWTAAIGVLWVVLAKGLVSPLEATLVIAGLGAVLACSVGVDRLLRRPATASAWVGEQRVAASEDVLTVEGNAYFPLTAVTDGVLTRSKTWTVCPWKGVARYYNLTVPGTGGSVGTGAFELPDAAWSYLHPLPLARRVKGRVAFWGGVDVRG